MRLETDVKLGTRVPLSWVIVFAIISYFIATDIYTPSMPSITKDFSVSGDLIQFTLVSFMLGSLVFTICSGALAEHFGRRRIFVSSQVISVVASAVCIFAQDPYTLIVARFFQGMGGVVSYVLGFSTVQDVYTRKESIWLFAIMGGAFAVVPALAPIAGGYLDVWFGWRANFVAMFVFMLASLVFSYFFFHLPEGKDQRTPTSFKAVAEKYKLILRNKKFIRYASVKSILISGEWCYLAILPFYFIQVIGVSAPVYGYYLGAILLCYGIGSYLSAKSIEIIGYDRTLTLALVISFLAGIALLFVHLFYPKSPELIALCIGIYLFAQGKAFTPSITKALESFETIRASASSVRAAMNTLFSMLGTLAASLFNDLSLLPLSLYLVVLPLVGLIIFKFLREE